MKTGEFWYRRDAATATGSRTVTPSDAAPVVAGEVMLGFLVEGTGDVVVVGPDGTTDTYHSVPAYTLVACPHTHVKSTGTTANGIHSYP